MIRDATPDDIPRLVAMGERFLTETVYLDRRVPINPVAMARTVAFLLASDLGAVFVSERQGTVVGMIGLLLFENPITGEPTVTELFWWTEVEQRGPESIRLLHRGEQWARASGAVKMHMVAPVDSRIGRLYQRRGYEELETNWQLDFAYVDRDATKDARSERSTSTEKSEHINELLTHGSDHVS